MAVTGVTSCLFHIYVWAQETNIYPSYYNGHSFQLLPTFAATVNRSEGQICGTFGVFMPQPAFSRWQLHVASSGTRSQNNLKIYIADDQTQRYKLNWRRVFGKHVIYGEV